MEALCQQLIEKEDAYHLVLQHVLETSDDLLSMSVYLGLESHRSQKNFEKNPVAFLVKKMRDSEVIYCRLPEEQKKLFDRAKSKEVSSFLSNEAVRKCLDDAEIKEAFGMGRILRAQWVLTWKLIPLEDRQEAL